MMTPQPVQSTDDPRGAYTYACDMRDTWARDFARSAAVGGADEWDAQFALKQFILWEAQVQVLAP